MVETITIRPEPLTASGAPAPSVARASTVMESSEPKVAFEDLASREFYGMVKSGGSASELSAKHIDFFAPTPAGGTGNADTEFGFADFLDIINPLQHIPVVSTIYRELTGDTIKPALKVIGSAMLGGITGLASGVVDAVVETQTGKDIGQNMLAMLGGDEEPATQVAKAEAPKQEEKEIAAKATVQPASVQLASVPQAPLMPGYGIPQTANMPLIPATSKEDQEVMALFGNSNISAHASYKKANMLSYLTDVTRSNKL